jgi:hypothetical protein
LDIRRQKRQIEELSNPSAGKPEPLGGVDVVTDDAAIDGVLDLMSEGKHQGNASRSTYGLWFRRWHLDERFRETFSHAMKLSGNDANLTVGFFFRFGHAEASSG